MEFFPKGSFLNQHSGDLSKFLIGVWKSHHTLDEVYLTSVVTRLRDPIVIVAFHTFLHRSNLDLFVFGHLGSSWIVRYALFIDIRNPDR